MNLVFNNPSDKVMTVITSHNNLSADNSNISYCVYGK